MKLWTGAFLALMLAPVAAQVVVSCTLPSVGATCETTDGGSAEKDKRIATGFLVPHPESATVGSKYFLAVRGGRFAVCTYRRNGVEACIPVIIPVAGEWRDAK